MSDTSHIPRSLLPTVLTLAAFTSLCAGGFIITLWLGLFLTGLSFAAVAVLVELGERRAPPPPRAPVVVDRYGDPVPSA
jgi:hypothetical protein